MNAVVQLQLLMMPGLVSTDNNFFVGQQTSHLNTPVESFQDENYLYLAALDDYCFCAINAMVQLQLLMMPGLVSTDHVDDPIADEKSGAVFDRDEDGNEVEHEIEVFESFFRFELS